MGLQTPLFIFEEQILDFPPIACFKTRLAEFSLISVLSVHLHKLAKFLSERFRESHQWCGDVSSTNPVGPLIENLHI